MIEDSIRQLLEQGTVDDDGAPIEIELADDEMLPVATEMSIEVSIEPEFTSNLAETLDESYMSSLANDLINDYENDKNSRKEWEEAFEDGLELLGLKTDDRMEPWPGACGVHHPLLLEAVVRFQAEMITETMPATGPVDTEILGKITPEKMAAAERVASDMNYQITKKMPEFRNEQERLYWALAITGSAFKKVYYDPALGRQTSMFVPAEDFVVAYGTSDLITCPRATHVMRKTHNELRALQINGFYLDVDIEKPARLMDRLQEAKDKEEGYSAQYDDRHVLLEMAVDLDLEGYEDKDGLALPYIVTIEKQSMQILSIRRNWTEDDDRKLRNQHFVHYPYVPGFGFYGFGLLHIVGGFAKSATSLMRQLIDAGTLSNLPGGFKARGMRVLGDDTPISPGEFRDVDVPSGTLTDNIMPLPYKEPSATLYQLLQTIVDEGRRMASVADLKIADMSGQTPVGTTLAILERTLKVMSAVQSRVYYALDQELKLLAKIIRDNGSSEYEIKNDDNEYDRLDDYDNVEIIPVSNPNASTMAQRVVQYQAVLQLAEKNPQIYNLPNLHRQMLEAMGVDNVDDLIPASKQAKPTDPVSENMNLMKGGQAKAFIYQDHTAHMTVHVNLLNDPKMAQAFQNMPNGQAMQAAITAHIMEHAAFQYRQDMESQLGITLPAMDEEIPEELETQLSGMMSQAADMLLQRNQMEASQQQIQQKLQDPVIQLQQQELQIKAQDTANKIQIEKMKIDSAERIAAINAGIKAQIGAAQHAVSLMGAELQMEQAQQQAEQAQAAAQQAAQLSAQQAAIQASQAQPPQVA